MRVVTAAALALGVLQVGCAARDSLTGSAGRTTVVLLIDEDGTTGRARVSNARGAVELTRPGEATDVVGGQGPERRRIIDDPEVQQVFGAALAALPLPSLRTVLRFRFDSDELTDESRDALPALVRRIRERPAAEVVIIGHTDTVGTRALNFDLGQRRADSVRRILVDAGVSPDFIDARSHGEADLLVRTRDETPEPANRRVEITLR